MEEQRGMSANHWTMGDQHDAEIEGWGFLSNGERWGIVKVEGNVTFIDDNQAGVFVLLMAERGYSLHVRAARYLKEENPEQYSHLLAFCKPDENQDEYSRTRWRTETTVEDVDRYLSSS